MSGRERFIYPPHISAEEAGDVITGEWLVPTMIRDCPWRAKSPTFEELKAKRKAQDGYDGI